MPTSSVGVVMIDMQIAVGLYRDVDARMPRQKIEHVIEKADSGRDIGLAGAIQIDRHLNVGFLGFSFDRRRAHENRSRIQFERLLTGG